MKNLKRVFPGKRGIVKTMKKTLRVLALVLGSLMLIAVLTSCFEERLSGTYKLTSMIGDLDFLSGTLTFSGEDVRYTVTLENVGEKTYVGEYEIHKKLGTIEFDFDDRNCPLEGAFSFSRDKEKGTITIGDSTYTKQ